MVNHDIKKAKEVLESFMTEMNLWEIKAFPMRYQITSDEGYPIVHELQQIYNRWLVKKERKFGRLIQLNGKLRCANVGFPPEYDPEYEKIVSHEIINDKKIVFHTELQDQSISTLKTQLKYTILFINGEYKIDKKEEYSLVKEKWILLHM